jgi:hypothetical protein
MWRFAGAGSLSLDVGRPSRMIPIKTLIELVGIATEPWGSHGQFHAVQPTAHSIEKIQRDLSIIIPADYIQIASACPSYVGWFASIGEDYDHPCHILPLNGAFHNSDDPPALCQHFILLNHGHDGDCDCWDIRATAVDGEHPIVYVDLESDGSEARGICFGSFRAYLEHFVRYHAPRAVSRSGRRRAQSLLEECDA